ncbi:hypothetical protein RF11_08556 [Thelohanellus kitauei]|uniref:Uncharacterized protein n=1 Tax=Thelohanellus kitauei TaxID=669202 RepID=A0A0C2MBE6_THEKT|nr:hypothetical protein RF11_08556 [Thelohanellus kitauei]
MATDESIDISDTIQIPAFVRTIYENFDVIEEILGLESLHSTTKGSDLCESLKNLGEDPGIVAKYYKYHFILHQEALCGKTLNLKNVMDVVVRCVNKIRSRALNRQEFREFLSDMNEEYGELLQHCGTEWLSKGKEELHIEREYILNDDWLKYLAFMVGITSHLNCLNERLQDKDKQSTNLSDEIYSFKMKLRLFIRQLTEGIIDALLTLKARLLEKSFNAKQYRIKL